MPPVRTTHTFTEVPVPAEMYDHVCHLLMQAGYGHAALEDDLLDMNGLALKRLPPVVSDDPLVSGMNRAPLETALIFDIAQKYRMMAIHAKTPSFTPQESHFIADRFIPLDPVSNVTECFRNETNIESAANTRQVGGAHYGLGKIQHWDLVTMFGWDYFQGQIIKYVMRWKAKNGVQDLEKAIHYTEKYLEEIKAGRIPKEE